jgi:hypothetical protein
MNKIDKRMADLYKLVDICKAKHTEYCVLAEFHAILCQLDMLSRELEDCFIIPKCKCECDDL